MALALVPAAATPAADGPEPLAGTGLDRFALGAGETGFDEVLRSLVGDPRLVHVRRVPPRQARHGELATPLPPGLFDHLGVEALWSHQATAVDLLRSGRSVAIATGTASGKSLCFQAAIGAALHPAGGSPPATALLLVPTKALAQDQLRALGAMDLPGVVPATYDGDATPEQRAWARAHANVVLTNPEMLHLGVLPHHDRWAHFLRRLRYVVVDELHLLRGIFGSHVAHLLRRLGRLCQHYGSDPTFAFTSATLGRAGELAGELCGRPVVEVSDDGSPSGERLFVLWNPTAGEGAPGEAAPRQLASTNAEAARLTAGLLARGHRTITFCRSRKATEVVAADVRRRLGPDLAASVQPYRGGYLREERRQVERRLFGGELRGVVATMALELGIDVGGLDACVLSGFPGTIASLRQQAGRAGRGTAPSLAILVAGDDQLDQWFMAHPDEVFTRPPEPAVVNPSNPYVLLPHLACAAYELPLRHQDERWWPDLDEGVRRLVLDDRLKLRHPDPPFEPVAETRSRDRVLPTGSGGVGGDDGRERGLGRAELAVWAGRGWPSRGVGLRSGSSDEVRIARADGTLVGTVELARAFHLVHPGAIYLHQGQPYRVSELDLDDLVALVEPDGGEEYTQPATETDIALLGEEQRQAVGRSWLGLGPVRVRSRVVGYRRFEALTRTKLGTEELFLPPTELETRAFWYVLPDEVVARAGVEALDLPGALHAAEHAAIGILPLFTICDRWDVGGVSTASLPETSAATIVIYDGYPGGSGVAELGFSAAGEHLAATLEVIGSCACTAGCPSCVQSPKCGNGNEPLDKAGAVALLRGVLR